MSLTAIRASLSQWVRNNSAKLRSRITCDVEGLAHHNGVFAACYELVFRAAASDSNTPSQEFCSFSTSRLAACSKDTTRNVFGAPS
jgi:hypothetical protein